MAAYLQPHSFNNQVTHFLILIFIDNYEFKSEIHLLNLKNYKNMVYYYDSYFIELYEV